MARNHAIVANGMSFPARTGELILDAALNHGVDFPHDCRAGRCGSCTARVVRGVALGGATLKPGVIQACQARALADLVLEFDVLPKPQTAAGEVASLVPRGPDVVEVGLALAAPLRPLPGQYCQVRFRGFPARAFSPTAPADGSAPASDMTLHVKRIRNGRVSTALGEAIRVGHRVRVEGPFGTAFYRRGATKRLVLVAGGTGYAPILAVALAALAEAPDREMVLIVGARTTVQLYMVDGLIELLRFANLNLVLAARDSAPQAGSIVRHGDPDAHLPVLGPDDLVYAAGAPAMVGRVSALAAAAGADFHCDPFEASGSESRGGIAEAIGGVGRRVAGALSRQALGAWRANRQGA
jgi:NAD(P)H-flavin reductase/ferredoxin